MPGPKRELVKKVIRDNCRKYVQHQRWLDIHEKNPDIIDLSDEELVMCRREILTEYNLKNIVYFAVADAIQPNLKSLGYPPWQANKGEDLIDFYRKVLAIYKMKVNTTRNGIRATEKREALEAMIRTLYQNGRRDICKFVEQSERLDFFRAGYEKDLAIADIAKYLHIAQVRLTQERDNSTIRTQYCSFKINAVQDSGSDSSFEGDLSEEVNKVVRGFEKKSAGRRSAGYSGTKPTFPRKAEGSSGWKKRDSPYGAKPDRRRSFDRRKTFNKVNGRFPEVRKSYNRDRPAGRFRRRGKFFRQEYRDQFRKALIQLCEDLWSSDSEEFDKDSLFESAQITYDEGLFPDSDEPENLSEVEEIELGEVNMMNIGEYDSEYEDVCCFVPKRFSDLLYCQARFSLKKHETIKCLMDSGSSVNLIRSDAVMTIGAKKYIRKPEKPINVFGFNDVKTEIQEEIVLELTVGPIRIKTKFLVVSANVMKAQRVILGKPALQRLGFWEICERFMRERLRQ